MLLLKLKQWLRSNYCATLFSSSCLLRSVYPSNLQLITIFHQISPILLFSHSFNTQWVQSLKNPPIFSRAFQWCITSCCLDLIMPLSLKSDTFLMNFVHCDAACTRAKIQPCQLQYLKNYIFHSYEKRNFQLQLWRDDFFEIVKIAWIYSKFCNTIYKSI